LLVGCLAAFSWLGLILLRLIPLLTAAAEMPLPPRGRVVTALIVWGWWGLMFYDALT